MSPKNSNDILEITNIVQTTIQAAIGPLSAKIGQLDDKVNALALDRVTRSDIEKLRTELTNTTVQKDVYETRHLTLIQRDAQLEESLRNAIREHQEDIKNAQAQNQIEMQRVHERLESGKQQFEKRMDDIEDKIEKAKETELTTKDRVWLRISIIGGSISVAVAIIQFLMGHIHFN
jgi:chromosome segregation ATPase